MDRIGSIIKRDHDILGGTPSFRGTRVPFRNLLDYSESRQTLDEFRDDFSSVSRAMAVETPEKNR